MCGQDIHQAPVSVLKNLNKYIIIGHVPTYYLNDTGACTAYRTPYYMDIDCGRGKKAKGGKICCYDVLADKEIYV